MKPLIFIFFLINSIISYSQITLTIEINDLKSNKGQILMELDDKNEKKVQAIIEKIKNNKCTIVLTDLKPGEYAFKYFHDENNNNKLDQNWIGIPTEGFGFSNNPKVLFGPPSFDKTLFNFKKTQTLKCSPIYFLKI